MLQGGQRVVPTSLRGGITGVFFVLHQWEKTRHGAPQKVRSRFGWFEKLMLLLMLESPLGSYWFLLIFFSIFIT